MPTPWNALAIKSGGTSGTTPLSARRALGISEGATTDNMVSVKDFPFRAVGDGVTDDTAAVVAFLLAISGKAGYMPAGTYKVTSTLSLTKGTLLYGDGVNSIINYTGAVVAVQAVGTSDNWRSAIRDIRIQTTTGTHGLRLKDLADFYIENIVVTGFSVAGIHLTGTAGTGMCLCVTLDHVYSLSNTGDGLLADQTNIINRITFIGGRYQGNLGSGMNWQSSAGGVGIFGVDMEGNSGVAELQIDGAVNGFEVSGGCYFESIVAHPSILLSKNQESYGVVVTGNTLTADVAYANAFEVGQNAFSYGLVYQGNNIGGSFTNALGNPGAGPALHGATIGPNKCQGSIVPSASLRGSGVTIQNENNRSVVTYSASMTPNCSLGTEFDITVTNNTNMVINTLLSECEDMIRLFTIRNASGGAMGTITWPANFKMLAFTVPTNGNSCSLQVRRDSTNWVQIAPQSLQIPN